MIIHTDIKQGSPEWLALRVGLITGTRMQIIAGEGATKKSTDAKAKLAMKIAAERITGVTTENDFKSLSMIQGSEREAAAREVFRQRTGIDVFEVGFCEAEGPYESWVGFSPDGLIEDTSGLEIKCPEQHTHLDYLINGIGDSYKHQIQTALWISGYEYWEFMSYCPEFSSVGADMYRTTIYRDDDYIKRIESGVTEMIDKVSDLMYKIEEIAIRR